MNKTKVAILGMGNMGRNHLNELRKFEDVEIVSLCSVPREVAEEYNAANGTNYPIYTDFDQMLAEREIDALFVCLPPFAHDGQIEKAAQKGIHIFTEKPLALNLERGESMAKAVAQSGVFSQMGYHMRFGKAVRHVRRLMESGIAGKATLFSANYECNDLHVSWWRDRTKSGGQIFEQIIHLYDMAYFMMGKVDLVTGFIANVCHQDVPGYTVEDTSAVSLRFRNGTVGCITASNNAIPGRWVGIIKIVLENMVVEFFDHNNCRITYTREGNRVEEISGEDNSRYDEDRYFIDVVQGKEKPFATIAEGLDDLKIVSGACYSSEHEGTPVHIAD